MPETRVLKYNEVNVLKQKEVCKIHEKLAAKNKRGTLNYINILRLF